MKLWLDDIRPAPEGWEWARTVEDAIDWLENYNVEEISLDHDLGLDHLDPSEDNINLMGTGIVTGFHLVKWMCYNSVFPPKITIHSWNYDGARRMAQMFSDYGVTATVEPY